MDSLEVIGLRILDPWGSRPLGSQTLRSSDPQISRPSDPQIWDLGGLGPPKWPILDPIWDPFWDPYIQVLASPLPFDAPLPWDPGRSWIWRTLGWSRIGHFGGLNTPFWLFLSYLWIFLVSKWTGNGSISDMRLSDSSRKRITLNGTLFWTPFGTPSWRGPDSGSRHPGHPTGPTPCIWASGPGEGLDPSWPNPPNLVRSCPNWMISGCPFWCVKKWTKKWITFATTL